MRICIPRSEVEGDGDEDFARKLKRLTLEGASNVDLGVDCPQDGVESAR